MSSDYTLSATLELKDKLTAGLKKTGYALSGVQQELGAAGNAVDSLKKKNESLKKSLDGIKPEYKTSVSAKDMASEVLTKVKESAQEFSRRTYRTAVGIKDNVSKDLARLREKLASMAKKPVNLPVIPPGGGLRESAGNMIMGATGQMMGAMGIGYGIYDAIKTYSDFTAKLSEIHALTGLDSKGMEQIKEKSMELGATTQYSSTEVADGMSELLKAGIDVKDVLNGATDAALSLASAGDLQLADAAEIMSTSMNAFHTKDAQHVADVLVGAANASATSVDELKYSMSMCSAVAAGMGLSIDDTAAALSALAMGGIKGSDAGTSLKTMLQNLTPATKSAADALRQVGLITANNKNLFYDSAGNLKSMAEIAGLLHDKFKDMTKEQRQAAFKQIFGTDGVRAATILYEKGAKGITDMLNAMRNFKAADVAAEKMDNLKGSMLRAKSAWDNLMISILDDNTGSGLRDLFDGLGKLFGDAAIRIKKDGATIKSACMIAEEGIGMLWDKFKAFDGFGSYLAGGALVAGLAKIISMAKEAVDKLKLLRKSVPKKSTPTGDGLPSGSTVGEMVVNAKSVIVNGATKGGAGNSSSGGTILGPDGRPIESRPKAPRTPEKPETPERQVPERQPTWRERFGGGFRYGRSFLKVNAALDAITGITQIMSADNKMRAASGVIGGTAGGMGGSALGASIGAAVGSLIPVIGTAVGAAVGGTLGGMAGYLFGYKTGSSAYDLITSGSNNAGLPENQPKLADRTQEDIAQTENLWDSYTGWYSGLWQGLTYTAQNQTAAQGAAMVAASSAGKAAFNGLDSSIRGNMVNISAAAKAAGGNMQSDLTSGIPGTKSAWGRFASWFSGLWSEIKKKASDIYDSIPSVRGAFGSSKQHNATGSSYYEGGLTEINEHGGEIVDLPTGSRIYPAATTERMLQKEFDGPSRGNTNVTIAGNTFYVREEADIDKIAYKLMQLMQQANANMNFVGEGAFV